jgi:leucine dehydrogenase
VRSRGFEQLFFCRERFAHFKSIIAIHNTQIGPGLGGWRIAPYENFDAMLDEVISRPESPFSLPETMTKKAVLAGVPFGGAKAVTDANPRDPSEKNSRLLAACARALVEINKNETCFYTGEDSGMNVKDVEEIARLSGEIYILGRSDSVLKDNFRGGGDPGLVTARGIIRGLKAACNFLGIGDYFGDKRITVQGIGSVGESFIRKVVEKNPGVKISACDILCDPNSPNTSRKKYLLALCEMLSDQMERDGGSVRIIPSNSVYSQQCDIFVPCSLRVTLNKDNIPDISHSCKIIGGAQNNPLATPEDGDMLHNRGIIYVPDYVINSGGLISVADELHPSGYSYDRVMYDKVWKIYDRVLDILERSAKEGVPPYVISDRMVEEKLEQLRKGSV